VSGVLGGQFINTPKTVLGLDIKIANYKPSFFEKIIDAVVIIGILLFIFTPLIMILLYGFANIFSLPLSVFKAASV
jgi:hypothetical protein